MKRIAIAAITAALVTLAFGPAPSVQALAARGESLASHRDGRGASLARRGDREYREYLREEQRCQRGRIARRMQPDFHHGLLGPALQVLAPDLARLEEALNTAPDDLKAGNDYRMAVIPAKAYDRAIAFFQKLVTANPHAANAHLNYGFAYVDKIPAAGAITQVILANNALGEFTKSLEIKPSWIGLYTRGNSYLFWPRIFNRTHLGLADLNEALKMQRADTKRPHYVRVYVALGDGYWKSDDLVAAANAWREGLVQYPDNAPLKARLSTQGDELKALIEAGYDPAKRVDTSLQDLWTNQ